MNLLAGPCEQCDAEQWHEIVGGRCLCEDCASNVRKRRALFIVFIIAALAWIAFMVWIIHWALQERGLW